MSKKSVLFKTKLVILLFVIIGCCKEEPPIVVDPIVGTWNTVFIDSGGIPVYKEIVYLPIDTLDIEGTWTFNKDGSGNIKGSIDQLTGGIEHFTWVVNDSLQKLFIISLSDLTYGLIQKLDTDSLCFYFKEWKFNQIYTGNQIYYNIKLAKAK